MDQHAGRGMPPEPADPPGYVAGYNAPGSREWHLDPHCDARGRGATYSGCSLGLAALARLQVVMQHTPCPRCAKDAVLDDLAAHVTGPGYHLISCVLGHSDGSRCPQCRWLSDWAEITDCERTIINCAGGFYVLAAGDVDYAGQAAVATMALRVTTAAGTDFGEITDVMATTVVELFAGGDTRLGDALAATRALYARSS